jgi:2-polyprenyl-3-methyl-5-hydroxy-6-metoxy-1,4-benzoquinol methylase
MQLFEEVICDLCKSNNNSEVYNSTQCSNSFGKINIKLVVCKNCGFIYQNPQLTASALDEHYQYNSSGNVFRESMQSSLEFEERKDFLIEIINDFNIKSICDVGGGKGEFLSYLEVDSSVKKILIEPSDAILENNNDIIKIQSKIEDLSYDTKFELVMCINSLEHFKSPTIVFDKISASLKDDGFIFIEVPNTLTPYSTIGDFFSYEHMNHFTYESLFYILKKFNFYLIKVSKSKHLNTIKLVARKINHKSILENTLNIFSSYKLNKEYFLNNFNIDEKLSSFSIYGAGEHTKYLIEKFNILYKVDYFIDSDTKKHGKYFFDKLIISPQEIEQKNIKNILISSHDFEDEIYNKLEIIFPGLNLITIYNKH